MITAVQRANSKDFSPPPTGQQVASRMIEKTLAIGVNAPQKSKRPVSAKASVFHRLTFPVVELWTAESNSIPMILTRNKNSAAPGNPVGNIEKSRCTD
jgi:hypothetical protein